MQEVSAQTAKEKNNRHGNISTLHVWWARKPLGSSRSTNFASLIPASRNPKELRKNKDRTIGLAKFGAALDRKTLEDARREILDSNSGVRVRALDPFSGGGSIPFEAMRLGCQTYASEYNPVALLILKCTIDYPMRYKAPTSKLKEGLNQGDRRNRLLDDVKKWGKWVHEEAKAEIGRYYPMEVDGSVDLAYLWARTIPCQNPSCNAQIPLMRQFWLAIKGLKKTSICPYVYKHEVKFKIVGASYETSPKGFDPAKGTVSKSVAVCLVCGSAVDSKTTRTLFAQGKSGQRMVAVISEKEGESGKKYRVSTDEDLRIFGEAERHLRVKQDQLRTEWGIDPVPDEESPGTASSQGPRPRYGFNVFGDYFNSRQKLALITFLEKVRVAHKKMVDEYAYDEEYSKAVTTYLALGVDRLADFGSNLCRLNPTGGRGVVDTFGRQALQMVWDYAESNPFNPSGAGWLTACEKNEKWIEHASSIDSPPAEILQCSATSIPYPDNYFEAVFTDPPYYDNVSYALLSDFFYVWLKRSVGDLYPEFFATVLTPKTDEIIADRYRWNSKEKAKDYYEAMLRKSFGQIYRVLKPGGIATVVFAHKSTDAWETLINSLLDSGLLVTAAWPIHTEKKGRPVSQETAALASSIYVVARKRSRKPVGFYAEIKQDLKTHLNLTLPSIWEGGISGADFFIAAIGASIQVFGRFEKTIDDEGNVIRADKLLEDVRRIVTDFAVKQVLHNGFAVEISAMTRFYILWRWAYADAKLEFDEARKLAQSVGVNLGERWNEGFIRKDKEFVSLLGPDERDPAKLEGSNELIDVLHNALLLWKVSDNIGVLRLLQETGFTKNDVLYKVAQAIAESFPTDAAEKKLLEGFLQGRGRISEAIRTQSEQAKLFE